MTRNEVAALIKVIVTAYPNFDKFKSEKAIKEMVDIWTVLFADDDGALVGIAVKKHISISKWPPAIAQIREIMADLTNPDLIPPEDAWAAVSQLLYTEGEYCHTDIHNILPQAIADTVDEIGYSNLYALHVASTRGYTNKAGLDRIAFIQSYDSKVQRARERAMLSPTLQTHIDQVIASHSTGERKMLECVRARYEDKKSCFERSYRLDISALGEPDDTAISGGKQPRVIEEKLERRDEEEDA